MDFWRAVGIINHRKWLIILSVIVATALTFGATRLLGARWVGEVRLMTLGNSPLTTIQSKGAGEADSLVPEKGSQRDVDRKQLAAIEAVLISREVAELAHEDLTNQNPPSQLPPGALSRVEVKPGGPGVYLIQYSDTNSARAASVANALARAFVKRFQEMRTEQAQNTVTLLESQVRQADAKLAEVRTKYDNYRNSHTLIGALSTEVEAATRRVMETTQRREDVKQRLADAQAQLSAKERELSGLPVNITKPGQPLPDPNVNDLRKELRTKQNEYNALAARYNPEHPLLKKAKADVDEINRQLTDSLKKPLRSPDITEPNPERLVVNREVNRLRAEVAGLSAQLPAMNTAISTAQAEMNRYKGADTPIATMAGEVTQATDMRNGYVNRLNLAQVQLDAAKSVQPISIAADVNDSVNPPYNATQGRTQKLIILAFLAALIGTSALIIALDSVDRRVKTVGQAEIALPARVIAAIPQPMGNTNYVSLARATEMQPSSLHSEAYRFLGLHLLSPRGPKVRSLMVLSAKAEQGSTTTVTNLAITLAQANKKVVLVDANVRTAELHKVFETTNEFGFTDLLRDPSLDNLDRALRPTGVANLQIITSGPMTDNAWQLFRSDNLIELSRRLHERADFVLYDTPSALIFTDALNLAPVVDAAFLCVRALEPLTGAEQRVVELLEQNNVTVLGSVLNDVPTAVVEGYHNYQHYYSAPTAGGPALAGRMDTAAVTPLLEMPPAKPGRKNGSS